jgi:hypothetical protein
MGSIGEGQMANALKNLRELAASFGLTELFELWAATKQGEEQGQKYPSNSSEELLEELLDLIAKRQAAEPTEAPRG